ncbi:HEAT repeat domain-containing protein [Lyngbya confervoides]|uniref:HEAT repeat domain-containing protein n=1 Tax=Lyngbya confervoides BDU141951 TaxID=1574623 RepID=A0ABD4T4B8_9CYAN|nr:HEAT repeat domain-containing protein [Lyngbya confervoides]MCM1983318.1 HEAT repeat domain-containing protein [Lyngbya confervoides BDU141951]
MTSSPDSIQKLLTSEDFGDRIHGLNELRTLDAETAWPLLIPLIKDAQVRVRYAAVSQMDTVGIANVSQARTLLLDRLHNDPEADVRAAAADAIGALQIREAFPDLKRAYEGTSDWLIQMSIIACLGELGAPEGFELLKTALASPEPLVQLAAISSLGELQQPEAIPLLVPFLQHEDWQVRQRLVQAFSCFDQSQVAEYLQRLTQDEVDQVANYARDCLQPSQAD